MRQEHDGGRKLPVVAAGREAPLRRLVTRFDLFYTLPVVIAVGAFILAVFVYFR